MPNANVKMNVVANQVGGHWVIDCEIYVTPIGQVTPRKALGDEVKVEIWQRTIIPGIAPWYDSRLTDWNGKVVFVDLYGQETYLLFPVQYDLTATHIESGAFSEGSIWLKYSDFTVAGAVKRR